MRRYLLIFAALLLLGEELKSQMTTGMTDSLTYRLYLEKKWEQLLTEAEKAIREKVDFYYLHVRAGVAAYELGKYRKAVSYLETAYNAFRDDDFVNSYYYYALVMAGRKDEAVALTDHLSPGMLKKAGLKRKDLVSGISVESLISWNAGYSGLLSGNIGTESAFSNYRTLLKKQFYRGIALDHHILPGFDLYHHFSHIGIDRMEQFRSTVNFLDTVKSTRTSQYQYFLSGRIMPGDGWTISAAFSRLWGESQYHIPEYISPWNYNLSKRIWEIDDYVFSAGIAKELLWMRPKLGAGIARINGYRQLQANLQVIVYPAGNLNFYLTPEATLHFDESESGAKFVFGQGAGIKTGPFWLSLDYAVGNMKNFFSGDGLVVYNMPESIRQKKGISVWLPLLKYRMEATLRLGRSEKKGTTFVYTDLVDFVPENYRFNENSILFSLKWNL